MRARSVITAVAIAAIVTLAPLARSVAAEAASASVAVRNVVLIIGDDMNIWPTEDGRAGDLYAGAVSTPSLDALASRGHLFQRAYADTPLCSPSRAGGERQRLGEHHRHYWRAGLDP